MLLNKKCYDFLGLYICIDNFIDKSELYLSML